ncbi:hypothetical protein D3C78_1059060 [compost metagenome]
MVWVIDYRADELHTFFQRWVFHITKVEFIIIKHQLLIDLRVEWGMDIKFKEPEGCCHALNFWTLEGLNNLAQPILVASYKLVHGE